MKLNQNAKIIGKKVILVPYETNHVARYHEWMQSAELQELTASEPLSLKDEYDMQRSWREDDDKCTFLVLDRELYEKTNDEVEALVGDTNLFLRHYDEDKKSRRPHVAEAEIMIAETSARGRGFGWEAMLLMMKYGTECLNIKQFEAKIGMKNAKSLQMFQKMHFMETSRSEVFQEITLQRPVDGNWMQWLNAQVLLKIEEYKSSLVSV